MRTWAKLPILAVATCALAGCGGDGGTAFIPSPPETQTPAPTEILGLFPPATTSQEFAVTGDTVLDGSASTLDPDAQIRVRYLSSNSYEVLLPDAPDWQKVFVKGDTYQSQSALLFRVAGDWQYSRLFSWNDGANSGRNAVGIATADSGVPVTGAATYSGQILGLTSEQHGQDFTLGGSIQLSFDFGLGSLSGSISPDLHEGFAIDPLTFRDTVYLTGSRTFSGEFDTNLTGANSFSGRFTGPNAEELIGSFEFPYRSPLDDQVYRADGAFVGKK